MTMAISSPFSAISDPGLESFYGSFREKVPADWRLYDI